MVELLGETLEYLFNLFFVTVEGKTNINRGRRVIKSKAVAASQKFHLIHLGSVPTTHLCVDQAPGHGDRLRELQQGSFR